MTAIADIARDLESLSVAAMDAARLGDWDAVGRYEDVRLRLVIALGVLAADVRLRSAAVTAMERARILGEKIGVAITEARARQGEQAGTALRQDRAGRAYAKNAGAA